MALNLELTNKIAEISKLYKNISFYEYYKRMGEIIVSDIKHNVFDNLGVPNGTVIDAEGEQRKWKKLAPKTIDTRTAGIKSKSGQWLEKPSWPPPLGLILQRTGHLREMINYRVYKYGVRIGSGAEYGKQMNATRPFLFLTKNALEDITEQLQLFIDKLQ